MSPSNDTASEGGGKNKLRGLERGHKHVGWSLEISLVLDMPRLRCLLEMSM